MHMQAHTHRKNMHRKTDIDRHRKDTENVPKTSWRRSWSGAGPVEMNSSRLIAGFSSALVAIVDVCERVRETEKFVLEGRTRSRRGEERSAARGMANRHDETTVFQAARLVLIVGSPKAPGFFGCFSNLEPSRARRAEQNCIHSDLPWRLSRSALPHRRLEGHIQTRALFPTCMLTVPLAHVHLSRAGPVLPLFQCHGSTSAECLPVLVLV